MVVSSFKAFRSLCNFKSNWCRQDHKGLLVGLWCKYLFKRTVLFKNIAAVNTLGNAAE